jgi:antitoxin CptB
MSATTPRDDELIRRRLRFRSWHRGTRESDLLIGGFADAALDGFDPRQLDAYAALLGEDDPDIWDWVVRGVGAPAAHAPLIELMRAHVAARRATNEGGEGA